MRNGKHQGPQSILRKMILEYSEYATSLILAWIKHYLFIYITDERNILHII